MSKTTNKFAPEVRERAVRMVLDHEGDHPSLLLHRLDFATTCRVVDRINLGPLSGTSNSPLNGRKVGDWSVYKPANLASRPAKAARVIKAHRLATIQNSVGKRSLLISKEAKVPHGIRPVRAPYTRAHTPHPTAKT